MASIAPDNQTKTSLYIASRHRETWIRFCNNVLPTDRSHIILVALKDWLDRKDGLSVSPQLIRQTVREELARALKGHLVQSGGVNSSLVLEDDQAFDDLAADILGGINFQQRG